MTTEKEGKVILEGDLLTFSSSDYYKDWTVTLDRIVVIGEYTTSEGPFVPDYFSIIIDDTETWHMLPHGAAGYQEAFDRIAKLFETNWSYGLANITDYASRVMWPGILENKPAFRFDLCPAAGWLSKLWGPEYAISLSCPVRAYLKSLAAKRPHEHLEDRLPAEIQAAARVSDIGEYAWRKEDLDRVLQAASERGLACIGGRLRFIKDITYDFYLLTFEPKPRQRNESWGDYVTRTRCEVAVQVEQSWKSKRRLRKSMLSWPAVRQPVKDERIDVLEYVWLVLYFERE